MGKKFLGPASILMWPCLNSWEREELIIRKNLTGRETESRRGVVQVSDKAECEASVGKEDGKACDCDLGEVSPRTRGSHLTHGGGT